MHSNAQPGRMAFGSVPHCGRPRLDGPLSGAPGTPSSGDRSALQLRFAAQPRAARGISQTGLRRCSRTDNGHEVIGPGTSAGCRPGLSCNQRAALRAAFRKRMVAGVSTFHPWIVTRAVHMAAGRRLKWQAERRLSFHQTGDINGGHARLRCLLAGRLGC
jgi:hypothetical protein